MNMTLEAIPVPVTETDKAIDFYVNKVGFKLDIDHRMSESLRFVQLTPPGSNCSIHIGEGVSVMAPGSVKGLILVVDSVETTKAEFDRRGVKTSEVEKQPWASNVYFSDPDGNSWTLQEPYARSKRKASGK